MKRLFIITNWEQLQENVLRSHLVTNWSIGATKGIDSLDCEHSLLYYNGGLKVFQAKPIADAEIILVFDKQYTGNLPGVTADDYLLHHSVPEGALFLEFANGHKKKGAHVLHNLAYTGAFNIIFDDVITNKIDLMIAALGLNEQQQADNETLETLTEAIFTAIYDGAGQAEIEAAVRLRNAHLTAKSN